MKADLQLSLVAAAGDRIMELHGELRHSFRLTRQNIPHEHLIRFQGREEEKEHENSEKMSACGLVVADPAILSNSCQLPSIQTPRHRGDTPEPVSVGLEFPADA